MRFKLIGVNHKTASVALRERVAFTSIKLIDGLSQAYCIDGVDEVLILSTCNRTEIYLYGSVNPEHLCLWLVAFHQLVPSSIRSHIYSYQGMQVVKHLMRVASGLDAQMIGEHQILGQVRKALYVARECGVVGNRLNRLFDAAIVTARIVRNNTDIGKNPVSVAYATTLLSKRIFKSLSEKTALLIGFGETIHAIGRYLKKQAIGHIIVANKRPERTFGFCESENALAISLDEIPNFLLKANVVISSTDSPLPILTKNTVEYALGSRKNKPFFIVDLAVPRDVEPSVAELDGVYYFTIDDLSRMVEANIRKRWDAAIVAESIVDTQANLFMTQQKSQQAVDIIVAYRNQAEEIRAQELQKAYEQLKLGVDPKEVIQRLSRDLVKKVIHPPCAHLKKNANENEDKISWVRELLNIQSINK